MKKKEKEHLAFLRFSLLDMALSFKIQHPVGNASLQRTSHLFLSSIQDQQLYNKNISFAKGLQGQKKTTSCEILFYCYEFWVPLIFSLSF